MKEESKNLCEYCHKEIIDKAHTVYDYTKKMYLGKKVVICNSCYLKIFKNSNSECNECGETIDENKIVHIMDYREEKLLICSECAKEAVERADDITSLVISVFVLAIVVGLFSLIVDFVYK